MVSIALATCKYAQVLVIICCKYTKITAQLLINRIVHYLSICKEASREVSVNEPFRHRLKTDQNGRSFIKVTIS